MKTASYNMIQDDRRRSLYSDLGFRIIAFLIDTTLLVFWLSIFVYFMIGLPQEVSSSSQLLNFQINYLIVNPQESSQLVCVGLYFAIIHWLYHVFMETSPRQATIGKVAAGIKVTDLRGRRISFSQANLRYFCKILSIFTVSAGFFMAYFTRRKQTIHDYLSRSLVIRS
ncbi:MAG: RDD family protein [Hymenobacteraceae bacterium]|nr:RDD family protein [Hymenobacteraceae bacterium]MDX5398024.1 RDD family protein [Hymenobacteraceae bacterium]MDX5443393.1 RDD family protein [Hymenobacteraceae bacterium]MDX5514095.1 RDD family protein [Hymenobacteraceae bacterium]